MKKEKVSKEKTSEQKNVISVGMFRLFDSVCKSLIKSFGAVFVYINSGKLLYVFLYLIIYALVQVISNYLLIKLFSKHPKLSLILGVIPSLILFSVFFINTNILWFMLIISVSNGLINSFYFAPIDVINGSLKDAGKTKTLSVIKTLEYLGGVIAVIVSGFVLDSVDVKHVALVGIILYLIVTIVFFFTYNSKHTTPDILNTEKYVNTIQDSTANSVVPAAQEKRKFNPLKNYYPWLAEALVGTITTLEGLWAVYIYMQAGSFAVVGIMKAVIAISQMLGAIVIGKLSNKRSWATIVLVSVILCSVLWAVRPFVENQVLLYALVIIGGFLIPLVLVPLDATYYKCSKNNTKKLVQKDLFRKLFAVPLALACAVIGSLPISIAVMGGMLGLTAVQILPASKAYKQNDK